MTGQGSSGRLGPAGSAPLGAGPPLTSFDGQATAGAPIWVSAPVQVLSVNRRPPCSRAVLLGPWESLQLRPSRHLFPGSVLIDNAALLSPWTFSLCVLPHASATYTLYLGAEGPHRWTGQKTGS